MRLKQVIIYVKDLNRMAAFYGQAFDLQPVEETQTGNWVEFETGTVKFALHAIPTEIADQIHITSPPQPREENSIKLSFEVDDIASEYQRLTSLGVTLVQRPWGTYDAIDPEGNVFGIYSTL